MTSSEEKQVFTLLQVCKSIEKLINGRYQQRYWIKAEMNKLNHYQHSGHCYPDLVQKENGKVIAQLRSTLWTGNFQRINQKFLTLLNEPLKDGIKILFLARIEFDALHGLTLNIEDIDPSFTLGDLEKEKQETIERLKKEGLFDLNKRLPVPMLPQRIAIISVESSKGYLDFLRILDDNKWKYSFFHMLFPSLLQGDKAIEAIIRQLNRIRKVMSHFDVVAIIRGGGGEVGLTCYNDYRLAEQIATFPLPVITGIGHSTNQTVVEMIAGINAITPTDMADILIQKFHNYSVPVDLAKTKIKTIPIQKLEDWKGNFLFQRRYFESQSMRRIDAHKNNLKNLSKSLTQESMTKLRKSDHGLIQVRQLLTKEMSYRLNTEKFGLTQQQIDLKKNLNRSFEIAAEQVNTLEKQIRLLHPDSVMKRGYSVTRIRGKLITSAAQVNIGDEIETQLLDGILTGIIQDKKANKPS